MTHKSSVNDKTLYDVGVFNSIFNTVSRENPDAFIACIFHKEDVDHRNAEMTVVGGWVVSIKSRTVLHPNTLGSSPQEVSQQPVKESSQEWSLPWPIPWRTLHCVSGTVGRGKGDT